MFFKEGIMIVFKSGSEIGDIQLSELLCRIYLRAVHTYDG